jgi:hypothetical protein
MTSGGRSLGASKRKGVSQEVGKSITGHVTDAMYARYNITSTEDQQKALDKVSSRGRAAVAARYQKGNRRMKGVAGRC